MTIIVFLILFPLAISFLALLPGWRLALRTTLAAFASATLCAVPIHLLISSSGSGSAFFSNYPRQDRQRHHQAHLLRPLQQALPDLAMNVRKEKRDREIDRLKSVCIVCPKIRPVQCLLTHDRHSDSIRPKETAVHRETAPPVAEPGHPAPRGDA